MKLRDLRGGFFQADNELIDIHGPEIGAYGIAVYVALCRYSRDNECAPSLRKLATDLAISRDRVARSLAELQTAGLIAELSPANPAAAKPAVIALLAVEKLLTPVRVAATPVRVNGQPVRVADANKESNTNLKLKARSRIEIVPPPYRGKPECFRCHGKGEYASISTPGKTVTCECVEVA